jgi:2-keto-4-pentenoate hydratase
MIRMAISRSAPTTPAGDHRREAAKNAAVARLEQAAATGVPCAPVRDLIGADDIPLAYLVQEQIVSARESTANRRIGRKIGLTSPAVQAQLKVDQPDFGTLLGDMSVPPGEPVAYGRLLQPRIEAEIAFILASDIDDLDPSLEMVTRAAGVARPAFEIVDSRISSWDITIGDTVADNASSGLFVLGDREVPLTELDPVAVQMTMTQDGETVSSGNGAACLGNPLIALQWLARVAASVGDPLRAGEIILSGALGPMVPVVPGSSYHAVLTGLGEIHVSFALPSTQGAAS